MSLNHCARRSRPRRVSRANEKGEQAPCKTCNSLGGAKHEKGAEADAQRRAKKQPISAQRQPREKEGAGAETGAGVSNIPVSAISHEKALKGEIGDIAMHARNAKLHFAANGRIGELLEHAKKNDANVAPVFSEERPGNQLRTEPRKFSLRRDSHFQFHWRSRTHHPVHESESKTVTGALSLAAAQGNTGARANRDFMASQLDRESLATHSAEQPGLFPRNKAKRCPRFTAWLAAEGGKGSRKFNTSWRN